MNLAARNDLEKLLSETGHALCLNDIDDVVELNRLADLVTDPATQDNKIAASYPIPCGGTLFYRPTIRILQWMTDNVFEWFANDQSMLGLSIAYCLSVGNCSNILFVYENKRQMAKAVKKWASTLDCTAGEIISVLSELLPIDNTDDSSKGTPQWGPVISMLCREYGCSPDYWLNECSVDKIDMLCKDHAKLMNEKIMQFNSQNAGAKLAPLPSPKYMAVAEYGRHKKSMRDKWLQKT